MKNNITIFACGLIMLSTQSFASEPAQIEGQPGAIPGGASIYECASSSSASSMPSAYVPSAPLAKIYKDQETQTTESGHNEQINAQLAEMLSNKGMHKIQREFVCTKLNEFKQKALSGDPASANAMRSFNYMLQGKNDFIEGKKNPEAVKILKEAGLVVFYGVDMYVIPKGIIAAIKAEGLLK
ncbi:MAG: hypothetical protein P4L31_02875 [Candidatus Babeliales bacterium]|nr:hypothetical protein [Candidatus Babeliales bacterium]